MFCIARPTSSRLPPPEVAFATRSAALRPFPAAYTVSASCSRTSALSTTTNCHGCRLTALPASLPASRMRSTTSSGIGRSAYERQSRLLATARCVSTRRRLVGLIVVRGADADGLDPRDDRFLRTLVQPLATPLDRRQELVEVDLERGEDPVGPVLHLEPRLACLAARVLDDLLRLSLCQL